MTNQERLQQNNAKIEALQEKLANKVVAKGTIEITENGKHNVAGYSDANVNVPVPDLSETTATADDVSVGKQFYNAQGELVDGSYVDMLQRKVDWSKSCRYLFENCPDEDMSWVNKLDISQATSIERMFEGCKNATIIDVSNFDTSSVTTMEYMFYKCQNVKELDISHFNTKNVRNFTQMFRECKALTNINLDTFDWSSATYINGLFYDCIGLTSIDVSKIDSSNVTDMESLFNGCKKLQNIIGLEKLKTGNSKTMRGVFYHCSGLTGELDLRTFDTSNVTTMLQMFAGCSELTSINMNGCQTQKLTDMYYMFSGCFALVLIDLTGFNTSKVTNFNSTFKYCNKLQNVIGTLDLISATNVSTMFDSCYNLEDITLKNIKISLKIGSGTSYGTLLTNETLINTIKELWDNTDNALGGSRTLTLSTTSKNNISNIYVRLIEATDEMRAEDPYIDNKKPCEVCESTDDGAMTLTEYAILKNWAIA